MLLVMTFIKPQRLHAGDTVGIVSPSWGGPHEFPLTYQNGLRSLEEMDLKIKEFPGTLRSPQDINANPGARANDLNAAFSDPEVKAIVATIGGNDSVLVLPHLDSATIRTNPKIFMGYSDTVTLHTYLSILGIVSYHGPAVMAGLSQLNSFVPAFAQHVRDILFGFGDSYQYPTYAVYSEGFPDWGAEENLGKINPSRPDSGPIVVQGNGKVSGRLCGGCIEVLEFLKGTEFWPPQDFWRGKLLCLETSEDKPSVSNVVYMLRNYGSQGILKHLSGILIGRPVNYSTAEKSELLSEVQRVVAEEFGLVDLPIIGNLSFGHTDPQWILPLGVNADFDCGKRTLTLLESWSS